MRAQRVLGPFVAAGIVLAATAWIVHASVTAEQQTGVSRLGPAEFPAGGRLIYPVVLPHTWDHVGPLAYDRTRNALWFVSSSSDGNQLNFYDISHSRRSTFSIPSTEINLLDDSGIGVAPSTGSVWFAFGSTLGRWDSESSRVQLVQVADPPSSARLSIPVPVEVSNEAPYRGLVIDRSGGVWIGRLGVAGLVHVSPISPISYLSFPQGAGDVRGGMLQPDGTMIWTTEFSGQRLGMLQEQVLRVDPTDNRVDVLQVDAESITSDGAGGFYAARHQLADLDASGKLKRRVDVRLLDDSIVTDQENRVWFEDETAPAFDRYDPRTGLTDQFGFSAPTVMVHTLGSKKDRPVLARPHVSNMVVDSAGDLWFSVSGGNQIGEVTPSN